MCQAGSFWLKILALHAQLLEIIPWYRIRKKNVDVKNDIFNVYFMDIQYSRWVRIYFNITGKILKYVLGIVYWETESVWFRRNIWIGLKFNDSSSDLA